MIYGPLNIKLGLCVLPKSRQRSTTTVRDHLGHPLAFVFPQSNSFAYMESQPDNIKTRIVLHLYTFNNIQRIRPNGVVVVCICLILSFKEAWRLCSHVKSGQSSFYADDHNSLKGSFVSVSLKSKIVYGLSSSLSSSSVCVLVH